MLKQGAVMGHDDGPAAPDPGRGTIPEQGTKELGVNSVDLLAPGRTYNHGPTRTGNRVRVGA